MIDSEEYKGLFLSGKSAKYPQVRSKHEEEIKCVMDFKWIENDGGFPHLL